MVDERLAACVADVLRVLDAWRQAEKRISGRAELLTLAAMQDMRAQVGRLVDRGFVGEAGPDSCAATRRTSPPSSTAASGSTPRSATRRRS